MKFKFIIICIITLQACATKYIEDTSNFTKENKEYIDSLTLSAEKNNRFAQYIFAQMYLRGDIVDNDQGKAEYWFKRSADLGNTNAQRELEKMHKNE